MIHLYPFLKKASLTMISVFVCSTILLAQTSPCGPIVENFDNTGGSMAGFSSSTQASTSPGFVYGMNGQDGFLERCNVPSPDSVYEIVTPTYQTLATQTAIGVGFELSGVAHVSEVNIFIEYFNSNTGTISTAWVSTVVPTYVANTATVCIAIPIATIPGFVPGGTYRLHIYLRPDAASNNNQCIVFDDFRTTGAAAQITLPVNFTSFTGRISGNSVVMIWNVAGETEVSHYEIEKSTDARNFTTIGEVTATGNSAYSFTDNQASGVVYYRVMNVDVDGKYKYTNVVRLNLSRSVSLHAYPLPFSSSLTIEHGVSMNGMLIMTSSNGQMVRSMEIKNASGQTIIQTGDLKAGMYIIRLEDKNGSVQTLKVIKQ